MSTNLDETELALLEALAKDATPTPWMGTIDPSHFYTFSTILGGEKKQSRGLNHQLIVQVGGWATVREQQANTRYIAAACNNVPALVAEVRMLREDLNKEHRAWQCAEGRGDWLEMENAALREKVEAWEWLFEVLHIVTGKQIGRASCRERVLRLV